jgi:hypothetical protein
LFEPVLHEHFPRCASLRHRAWGSIALFGWLAGTSGCTHEPLPCLLELEDGDLVITEIRGPQTGESSRGEWIELYNASGEPLDLRGLRGTLEPLEGSAVDGEAELTFLVRETLMVEPEGYVVLGTSPLNEVRNPGVDYSINSDFRLEPRELEVVTPNGVVTVALPESENSDPRNLFGNARVQLYACERRIDAFVYAELPGEGTWSYDGNAIPDADDNDDLSRWCNDATPIPPDVPMTATGLPGSPGLPNLPCPGLGP